MTNYKYMKEENWIDIEGYEGVYQVSNLGRVKSLNYHRSGKEKIMTPNLTKKGYLRIRLMSNGKTERYLVHRLVAQAFIPNHQNKPQVNHIDGNPSNNCVDNLEWCTNKENCNNPITIDNYKNRKGYRVYNSKPVIQFSENDIFIDIFDCANTAHRMTGIHHGVIRGCCNHRYGRKTAGSFKWEYLENIPLMNYSIVYRRIDNIKKAV